MTRERASVESLGAFISILIAIVVANTVYIESRAALSAAPDPVHLCAGMFGCSATPLWWLAASLGLVLLLTVGVAIMARRPRTDDR